MARRGLAAVRAGEAGEHPVRGGARAAAPVRGVQDHLPEHPPGDVQHPPDHQPGGGESSHEYVPTPVLTLWIGGWGADGAILVWTTNAGDVRNEKRDGEGGWHACWAATSPREGIENGAFYVPIGVKGRKFRENGNADLAGRLWGWTEGQLQGWGVEE